MSSEEIAKKAAQLVRDKHRKYCRLYDSKRRLTKASNKLEKYMKDNGVRSVSLNSSIGNPDKVSITFHDGEIADEVVVSEKINPKLKDLF